MQINVKKSVGKEEIFAVAVMQNEKLPFSDITKNMRKEEFEGKLGQAYVIDSHGKHHFRKLFLFGVGEDKDFNLDFARRFGGAAVRYAMQIKSASLCVSADINTVGANEAAAAVVTGAILANYKPIKFKSRKDDYFEVKELSVITKHDVEESVKKAAVLSNAQNFVRDVNENPANIATPEMLAETAREVAGENNLAIEVFGREDLKRMKMNAILGVNQGSALPPVLVTMEYNKDKKHLPFYAVVGKGITFDSGGICLKPSKGMQEMKYDKTGAVTVMGIMKAISEMQLPIRLMGAFASTENMPGGKAQKPGDIITAYNGKTIEVINTDAEGRLILSDTLAYIAEKKPEYMIDLATLTGAIIIALGKNRIGLFSNDDKLAGTIYTAGEKTFERAWRMPLDKEYSEMDRSEFADLRNIGSESGEAGSITAAAFLKEFVGNTKWAHLDIAAVDAIADRHPYLEKGASGIGLRLVCETLERLAKK